MQLLPAGHRRTPRVVTGPHCAVPLTRPLLALGSAPLSRSSRTTSTCMLEQASCRGVSELPPTRPLSLGEAPWSSSKRTMSAGIADRTQGLTLAWYYTHT